MSQTESIDRNIEVAHKIQEDTINAIHTVIQALAVAQVHHFPNNPLTIPTLHLAAICHYLNQYIDTFPEEIKQNVITFAYNTIGFSVEQFTGENDLINMKTVGTA